MNAVSLPDDVSPPDDYEAPSWLRPWNGDRACEPVSECLCIDEAAPLTLPSGRSGVPVAAEQAGACAGLFEGLLAALDIEVSACAAPDVLAAGDPVVIGALVFCLIPKPAVDDNPGAVLCRVHDPAAGVLVDICYAMASSDQAESVPVVASVSGPGADALEHPVVLALLRLAGLGDGTVASLRRILPSLLTQGFEVEPGWGKRSPLGVVLGHMFTEGARTLAYGDRLEAAAREQADARVRRVQRNAAKKAEHADHKVRAIIEDKDFMLAAAKAGEARQRQRADDAVARCEALLEGAGDNGDEAPAEDASTEATGPHQPASERTRELIARTRRAEHVVSHMRAENDALRQQVASLEAHVASLQAALNQTPDEADDVDDAGLPTSVDGLREWVDCNLGRRVVVHPKAYRATRKADFGDIPLLAHCLAALAEDYWPMRIEGDSEAEARWQRFLRRQHLRESHVGRARDNHRTADRYQVTINKVRYDLDHHLKGSSSRRESKGFRLYFCLDETTRRVVVGHFPTHLRNAMT